MSMVGYILGLGDRSVRLFALMIIPSITLLPAQQQDDLFSLSLSSGIRPTWCWIDWAARSCTSTSETALRFETFVPLHCCFARVRVTKTLTVTATTHPSDRSPWPERSSLKRSHSGWRGCWPTPWRYVAFVAVWPWSERFWCLLRSGGSKREKCFHSRVVGVLKNRTAKHTNMPFIWVLLFFSSASRFSSCSAAGKKANGFYWEIAASLKVPLAQYLPCQDKKKLAGWDSERSYSGGGGEIFFLGHLMHLCSFKTFVLSFQVQFIFFNAVTNILLHAACAAPDLSNSQLDVSARRLCPLLQQIQRTRI